MARLIIAALVIDQCLVFGSDDEMNFYTNYENPRTPDAEREEMARALAGGSVDQGSSQPNANAQTEDVQGSSGLRRDQRISGPSDRELQAAYDAARRNNDDYSSRKAKRARDAASRPESRRNQGPSQSSAPSGEGTANSGEAAPTQDDNVSQERERLLRELHQSGEDNMKRFDNQFRSESRRRQG